VSQCTAVGKKSVARDDLRALVDSYIADHQPSAMRDQTFFESMPSLELAIHHAAYALDHREPPKRYSHQRRIRYAPMRKAYLLLMQSLEVLRSFQTFVALHEFMRLAFSKIRGLGPLYTYDTALRIGFRLRLQPIAVYLHSGTRKGAQALGIRGLKVVNVGELPQALHVLQAHEIENFLCIFKPSLGLSNKVRSHAAAI